MQNVVRSDVRGCVCCVVCSVRTSEEEEGIEMKQKAGEREKKIEKKMLRQM